MGRKYMIVRGNYFMMGSGYLIQKMALAKNGTVMGRILKAYLLII